MDIDYEPNLESDEFIKQYDIIHYHRNLGPYEKMGELLDRIDKLGVITVMDLDDHWSPGPHHPAYHIIKNNNLDKLILGCVKVARNLTTTTDIFKKVLEQHNKNVFVLPNAIDPTEKQYTPNPEKSDRIRIGWLGGSSHQKDLEILSGLAGKLKSNGLIDKIQFVLCGFDLRGVMTIINEQTKEQTQRPIRPEESVWYQYEKIFTDNYDIVSKEYKDFLLKFKNEEYENVNNEPYRRVWTKPISTYATNYNLFDISLAPLEENTFNMVKSQLKVIEAGFHKKAIVAQNFGPYQLDVESALEFGGGVNENGNGILIDSNKNHKDWFKAIKKLIDTPDLIGKLGNKLHQKMSELYSIDKVTEMRRQYYLSLLSKR